MIFIIIAACVYPLQPWRYRTSVPFIYIYFFFFFFHYNRAAGAILPLSLSLLLSLKSLLSLIVNKFSSYPLPSFFLVSASGAPTRRGERSLSVEKRISRLSTNGTGMSYLQPWVSDPFEAGFFRRFNCKRHFYCFTLIL